MSKNPWFKCYPANFLDGVAELNPDQGWVYTIILMRIYSEAGPIPDRPDAIGHRCRMSKNKCERVIQSLADIGKIERIDGMISNNKAQKEIEKLKKYSQKQSEISQEGWKKRSEKTNEINKTPMASHGERLANAKPTEDRRQNTDKDHQKDDGFDEWYLAYPKHVGRGQAAKAYRAALKTAEPLALLDGAKRYAAERAGQDTKFTALPATWLNGERWLDEASTPVTGAADDSKYRSISERYRGAA